MPESLENLRETLADLERELAKLDEADEGLRARLEALQADISEALQRAETPQEIKPHSFIERLTAAEQQFEGEHPHVAGILRQLIDSLAQLGI
jgi:chromosome segregation ATPase